MWTAAGCWQEIWRAAFRSHKNLGQTGLLETGCSARTRSLQSSFRNWLSPWSSMAAVWSSDITVDSALLWNITKCDASDQSLYSLYSVTGGSWFCLFSSRGLCLLIFLCRISFCFYCLLSLFPYFSVCILENEKPISPGNHSHLYLSRRRGLALKFHFFVCKMGIISLTYCAELS